jgi:hypothetical protein
MPHMWGLAPMPLNALGTQGPLQLLTDLIILPLDIHQSACARSSSNLCTNISLSQPRFSMKEPVSYLDTRQLTNKLHLTLGLMPLQVKPRLFLCIRVQVLVHSIRVKQKQLLVNNEAQIFSVFLMSTRPSRDSPSWG